MVFRKGESKHRGVLGDAFARLFQFVRDIDKTNVDATNMYVCDMGKRNVFEAVASGGAGDLRFTKNAS